MFNFFTFAGAIFLGLGVGALISHLYYRANGKEAPAKVIAVEKFIFVSTGNYWRHKGTFYRPIYEYLFEGEPVWFAGGGTSSLDYEIGQQVIILTLGQRPEYCRPKNKAYWRFSIGFILFGIGAIAAGWSNINDWTSRLIPIILLFIIFFASRQYLIAKKRWQGLFKSSKLETVESLADRDIYWAQDRLEIEKASVARRAVSGRSVLFLLASIFTYFLWNKVPQSSHPLMLDAIAGKISFEELLSNKEGLLLFIFAIVLLFTLFSGYRLIGSILRASRL